MLTASPAAYALIRNFEGLRLVAYQCSSSRWTLGYGHTRGVKAGDRCSVSDAERWLREDVALAERGVRELFPVPLTQNQFDALTSFVFNIGESRIQGSGVQKLINAGLFAEAANRFLLWNLSGGKISEGLNRRRKAERELFLSQEGKPPRSGATSP